MPLRRLLILTAAGLLLTPGLAAAGVSAGTPFPTEPPDDTRRHADHGSAGRSAEAGLRHAPLGLRRRDRARPARRVQRPTAALDPVHRPHRPVERLERHRAPLRPRLPRMRADRNRPGCLGARGETHAARRVRRAPRPAGDVPAGRDHGPPVGRRRSARPQRVPPRPELRPDERAPQAKEYRTALRDALHATRTTSPTPPRRASCTTQSITADLDKIALCSRRRRPRLRA